MKGNEPAFPQTIDDMGTMRSVTWGLTKREYIATQAMIGIISNQYCEPTVSYKNVAIKAVTQANALINELNKTEEK